MKQLLKTVSVAALFFTTCSTIASAPVQSTQSIESVKSSSFEQMIERKEPCRTFPHC